MSSEIYWTLWGEVESLINACYGLVTANDYAYAGVRGLRKIKKSKEAKLCDSLYKQFESMAGVSQENYDGLLDLQAKLIQLQTQLRPAGDKFTKQFNDLDLEESSAESPFIFH